MQVHYTHDQGKHCTVRMQRISALLILAFPYSLLSSIEYYLVDLCCWNAFVGVEQILELLMRAFRDDTLVFQLRKLSANPV